MQQNPWMDDTFASSPVRVSHAGQQEPVAQPRPTARHAQGRDGSPFTSESSENSLPRSELEGSAEAGVSNPPSPRLIPMPADKILSTAPHDLLRGGALLADCRGFVRMGYLIGRGGGHRPVAKDATEAVAEKRVPIEGKVTIHRCWASKTARCRGRGDRAAGRPIARQAVGGRRLSPRRSARRRERPRHASLSRRSAGP